MLSVVIVLSNASFAKANSVIISVEAPGVIESQASNITTETFDGLNTTYIREANNKLSIGTVGSNNTVMVSDQSVNGGNDGGRYLFTNLSSLEIVLTAPARYAGFWWNAGGISDSPDNDSVKIFGSPNGSGPETLLATFTVLDLQGLITDSLIPDGHKGNPTTKYYQEDPTSLYAYVNLQLDDPDLRITRLEFLGQYFEVDNVSVSSDYGAAPSFPPTFDIAPAVDSMTSTGFTPSASINEAGVIYYVVVADGATAPSAAEVKAGQASGGGAALAAASSTASSSPFTSNFAAITSLSANTAYDVYFVAEDDEGTPNIQSSVTKVDATTSAAPDTTAPTLASSTPADDATGVAANSNIVLTFNEAVDTETGNIIIKKVSDNSDVETFNVATSTAISGSGTTTITINPTSDLASSTEYYIEIDATAFDDAAGNSYAGISGATTLNFTTAAPANTAPVANAGPDQTIASSAAVTLDGSGSNDADGNTLTYAWSQTSGTSVTLSSTTVAQPTFTAPTLAVGDADAVLVFSLTVNDGTVSSSADTVTITVEAPSPTPATAFAEYEEEIRATLVDDARRNLTSAMSVNQRLIRDARGRMIETQQALAGCTVDETQSDPRIDSELDTFECTPSSVSTRNHVPFDVDGTFALNGTRLSTRGSFFEQTGNYEGTQRRLFFGDFDVQHDADTDSTTATLTARVAWEQMISDRTMMGYFVGGELARSTIDGAFEGDQDRVGLTLGGYAVHQLQDDLFLDGFVTFGAGRNDLDMANDVLALESDYTTRTATIGAALSGVYEYEKYEFRPELAFSYGKTWIGNVGFTGRAYGLVDDTLSLDAGDVSIANLTLRPEVVWALDADTVADSNSQFSFAPRLICERRETVRRTDNCGGGAEIGLSSTSENGLSNVEFRVIMDKVGDTTRSSFALNLEHQF